MPVFECVCYTTSMQKEENKKISKIEKLVEIIATNVFKVTEDMTEIKKDVSILKKDVSILKKDVGEIKTDVYDLRTELKSF